LSKRTREDILADIEERKERIKDLQARGDEACSKYDLMFGYDANFYLNVCPLPANNIKALKRELIAYDKEHQYDDAQLTMF
jgi:hypothetical protein